MTSALRAAAIGTGLALAVTSPGPARGSGFLLPPPSAEALGRAGAVAADTAEPAAVWLNPAALAFAPARAGLSLTGTLADGRTRFTPEGDGDGVSSGPRAALLPALFAHARLHPRLVAGLGVHVPAGFATRWPEGWAGAQAALATRVWVGAATAVLAANVSARLALAAGGSLLRGSMDVRAALPAEVGGQARIEASGWGYAAPNLPGSLRPPAAVAGHLAASFRLLPDRLHLAAVYHARAHLDLSGPTDFSPENAVFAEAYADQTVRARLTLPDLVVLAVLVRPRPGLSLTGELQRASYGAFPRLALDFERPGTADLVFERGNRNPLSARAGAEQWLSRFPLALRAGLAFDDTATPGDVLGPYAPDARRLGLALGAGYLLGRWKLDVGYLFTQFLSARATNPRAGGREPPRGKYRSQMHALSLTVTAVAR